MTVLELARRARVQAHGTVTAFTEAAVRTNLLTSALPASHLDRLHRQRLSRWYR